MNRKTLLLSVFILIIIFVQTSGAQAPLKPGSPDSTFGTDGRILTHLKGGCSFSDAVMQPDDKFVVFCTNYVSAYTSNFRLFRFNADGALDGSFGVGGMSDIPLGYYSHGRALQLLPDGKMIIAGTVDNDFGMIRINTDGSLDTTFGVNGKVKTDFSDFEENSRESFQELLIRPDGKILLYGRSEVASLVNPCTVPGCVAPDYDRLSIAQYNADGSLDLSFGAGGLVKSRIVSDTHYVQKAFIEPDGKFQIFGSFTERIPYGYADIHASVRYNADGTMDANFGKDGILGIENGSDLYQPLPDGKLLGISCVYGCHVFPYEIRIRRYNSDFTADAAFGSGGSLRYILSAPPYRIELQPDGGFILNSFRFGKTTFYRFTADGDVAFNFGDNGAVNYDLDGSTGIDAYVKKILTQSDGKILAVSDFYPPNGAPGARGIVVMRIVGASSEANIKPAFERVENKSLEKDK